HDAFQRIPLLRAAMISLAILLGVGTVINDSGIVVPAGGSLFLVPILTHGETFRPGQSQPTGEAPARGGPGAAGRSPRRSPAPAAASLTVSGRHSRLPQHGAAPTRCPAAPRHPGGTA